MDSELEEDRMIQDNFNKNPTPAWLYLALVALVAALLWGGGSWFYEKQKTLQQSSPFLQVTNREFSLFLWQFPEYMRSNVSAKSGYLPGFQYEGSVAMTPGEEEKYVIAPPKVLFLYHTWHRLISDQFARRPISSTEFREFLELFPEWRPENWLKAPNDYRTIVSQLDTTVARDLSASLPKEVQQAFIGWKNYFVEAELINQLKPLYGEMENFLSQFSNYKRNFWRNIVKQGKPDYLLKLFTGQFDPKQPIPDNELAAFLKVAFFNYQQARKNL